MNKKRTLSLLIALLMLGSSFVSCSDATTDESAPDTQTSPDPSGAAVTETEETEEQFTQKTKACCNYEQVQSKRTMTKKASYGRIKELP